MNILARPLTRKEFAPFGQVIELRSEPDKLINQGMCGRHHALADVSTDGVTGISLFDAKPRHFPYKVDLVERHPLGSQAFIPMNGVPMLVIVAPDHGGAPGSLQAFLTAGRQGISLNRNTWHGVLAPMGAQGLYAVVDYTGDGPNLQEHWFEDPPVVEPPQG